MNQAGMTITNADSAIIFDYSRDSTRGSLGGMALLIEKLASQREKRQVDGMKRITV